MIYKITPPSDDEVNQLKDGTLTTDNMWWSWWGNSKNFGDWIGPYLYLKRTGRLPRHCPIGHVPDGTTVHFTCGSILQRVKKKNRAEVWGTGLKRENEYFMPPKQIHALRGPLTQKVVADRNLPVSGILGDPGICLPLVYQPEQQEKKYRLGVIPHIYDLWFWQRNLNLLPDDCVVIDLRDEFEDIIDQIASCESTLSSSLHGIIVSHAYGVPNAWMGSFSKELNEDDFKFRDYYLSVGLDLSEKHRRKIQLPFDIGDYASDLNLPTNDIKRMANDLMGCCPF